jgi:hypothetical protein
MLFVEGLYPGPDGALVYLIGRSVDWEASPHSGFGELAFSAVDDAGPTALTSPGGSDQPAGYLDATWVGPTGDLWLRLEEERTRRTVLRRYDGTGWETIDPPGEADGPHRFVMGPDGRLWDATSSSLWVHDGVEWSAFMARRGRRSRVGCSGLHAVGGDRHGRPSGPRTCDRRHRLLKLLSVSYMSGIDLDFLVL